MKELTYSQIEYRRKLKDLFSGIFVVTVLVRALRFLLLKAIGSFAPSDFYLLTLLRTAAEAISVFLPFFVMRKYLRDPYLTLFRDPLRQKTPLPRLCAGVFASAGASLALTGGMFYLLSALDRAGLHSAVETPHLGETPLQTAFYFVLTVMILPLAYEASFRGVALSALREENRLCAVLIPALAFAFCDGNLYHIPVRFAVGLLTGCFCLRWADLWGCIALHAVSWIAMNVWFCIGETARLWVTLIGFAVSIAAAVFLLRTAPSASSSQRIPAAEALRIFFTSFGIYLILLLTAFSLLVNVFSTDPDPNDPLLEPTPQEGAHPDFGRQDPLTFDRDIDFNDTND